MCVLVGTYIYWGGYWLLCFVKSNSNCGVICLVYMIEVTPGKRLLNSKSTLSSTKLSINTKDDFADFIN